MPVFTSSIEVTADYPTIKPSLNLNFARSRSLDPRITFTRASVGTYVGRDGLIKTAGEDEARFDHDPETLESLGLLIEESRTNIVVYSEEFDRTWWSKNGGGSPGTTVTANQAVAPDGTTTADYIDYTTATANSQNIEVSYDNTPAGKTYTASVWIKGTAGQTFNLTLDANGVSGSAQQFTLNGDWQRFSITRTYPAGSPAAYFRFGVRNLGHPSTGTATQVYAWGAQIELGSFPTSYIPTSGSAVIRVADRARITGTSFSNFFNTTEGTLVVQGRTSAGNSLNYTNQPIISINAGSSTNRIIMFDRDAGTLEWNVVDGSFANGSGVLLDETTSYSGAADYIMCGTYENGAPTRAVANGLGADGTTIESSGKNDTVNIFNQMDIGNEFGTRQCSSPIKQVRYYPLSLSDAEIKTLVQ